MDPTNDPSVSVAPEIVAWYTRMNEAGRLTSAPGQLELLRTQEILRRYVTPPPAVVVDVGGGTGVYAYWLADLGYEAHLVDPVPYHIEMARGYSERQSAHRLASMAVGDARQLAQPSESADAVLLLGPLYHLTERADRLRALAEAWRVLRSGGFVFAASICRYATMLNGFFKNLFADPEFVRIVERDIRDGQHRDDTGRYFTTSFLHHPHELGEEVRDAGFELVDLLAIEGVAKWLHDFEAWWADPVRREVVLAMVRATEKEPILWGVSMHLLAVGRKR